MQFLGLCVASLMGRFVPVQVGSHGAVLSTPPLYDICEGRLLYNHMIDPYAFRLTRVRTHVSSEEGIARSQ